MCVLRLEIVEDEYLIVLEKYGLNREDVWDIGVIVGFFVLFNRMVYLINMCFNDEFYFLGRVKKEK